MNTITFVSHGSTVAKVENIVGVTTYDSSRQVKVKYVEDGKNRIIESNISFIYFRDAHEGN